MTYFFDNHHPPEIVNELRENGVNTVHLLEEFDRGLDDAEWIPIVAERGWILITGDHRILRRKTERTIFRRVKLTTYFMSREYNNKRAHVRTAWFRGQRVYGFQ